MDIKDLKIGNWYSNNHGKYIMDYPALMDALEFYSEFQDVLWEPIPLTEEWLKEFGFWKSTEMTWYSSEPTEYNIPRLKLTNFKPKEDIPMLLDDKYGIHLKHVHQLQNLYFALTGKELIK